MKFCPIRKADCNHECAWYEPFLEKCAVPIIADELFSIVQFIMTEDEEGENEN